MYLGRRNGTWVILRRYIANIEFPCIFSSRICFPVITKTETLFFQNFIFEGRLRHVDVELSWYLPVYFLCRMLCYVVLFELTAGYVPAQTTIFSLLNADERKTSKTNVTNL